MTQDGTRFGGALAGSVLLHAILFIFLFALPAGVPNPEMVRIYRISVVEAPPQPKARRLEISTKPISALKLESPTLSVETPPEIPDAPTSAPPLQTEPAPEIPDAPTSAPPPPQATAPARLPALPTAPAAAPAAARAPSPPPKAPAQPPEAPPLPPTVAPKAPSQPPSLLEQMRLRVEQLKTRSPEPAPPLSSDSSTRTPRSRISLRMYKTSVQEEVQRKYKFPGGFDKDLWVRVRLVIARDGTIRNITFLERSGNEHFDRAALLSIRRTKLPPIPDGIEGDTISQVVLFRP